MSPLAGPVPGCLSSLRIDELVDGELEEAARVSALEHLSRCERCQERHATTLRERDAFRASAVPLKLPTAAPRVRTKRVAATGFVALVAAAAMSLLYLRPSDPSAGERTKGGTALDYYVKRGNTVFEGAASDPLYPGDAIQFRYAAANDGYLAILSRDGKGTASVYYPSAPEAAPIRRGIRQALPQSTVLDDALGRETIYAYFCPSPVTIEPLRHALEANPSDPPRAGGCTVETLVFEKRARP